MNSEFTRRQFLKLSARLTVLMGLGSQAVPGVAQALSDLAQGRVKVIWLQAQACSGCSISVIDSEAPGTAELLTRYISLVFHHTLSASSGALSMEVLQKASKQGGHILVVEGSIPADMPEACIMGHRPVADVVAEAARGATHIISLGACACFGGIPGAEGNPTGAISVPAFLEKQGISKPMVAVPGCPSHPDWFVGTLVYLTKFGLPPMDDLHRPTMFFGKTNHEKCPRFYDYERENFAEKFGDDGCLFNLGCLGVVTRADCTLRDRNGGTNNCIKAGGPCIGCSSEIFALKKSLPFYRKGEINP